MCSKKREYIMPLILRKHIVAHKQVYVLVSGDDTTQHAAAL